MDAEAVPTDSIIVDALAKAGISSTNLNVGTAGITLDGLSKGQTKGESLENRADATSIDTKSPEPEPTKIPDPTLSKVEIEAAINQASSKFQSLIDRKINQLQTQMTGTIQALNQFFQGQEDGNLASLPEADQVLKRLERLEKPSQPKIQIQQPIDQQPSAFYQQLVNFVDAVGLKVDDSRIDWAPDAFDPQTGFNRFLASIKTVLVADQTKTIQDLKASSDKELLKVRNKAGIDQVSTGKPSGAGLPDLNKLTPFEKIEMGFKINEELASS